MRHKQLRLVGILVMAVVGSVLLAYAGVATPSRASPTPVGTGQLGTGDTKFVWLLGHKVHEIFYWVCG